MPELTTQSQLAAVQNLDFCYHCGKSLRGYGPIDRDHVPPKSIFAVIDRTPSLILPTHKSCNQGESSIDEHIGQLLSSMHGKMPSPGRLRLHLSGHENPESGERVAVLSGLDLKAAIWRCIRGFHAALYREFLPESTEKAILPPFPSAQKIDGALTWDAMLPQFPKFVEHIKKNRETATIDRIVAFNGKCCYECTWDKTDDGRHWLCLFGLRIYDWIEMADETPAPSRGCVGSYMHKPGLPEHATISTQLEFKVQNADPYNPFGV
jgi:hypothetical protein